ncbi:MAG: glycosyltransferase [Chloroflexi bacterium]|nr:glycosyltransferase [Chloroflexota bacterium]
MDETSAPALAVIIATPDNYETVRAAVGLLAAQTAHATLEVLIVAPSTEVLAAAQAHVGAALRLRVVPVASGTSVGAANAAGVRAAQAPLVAFIEEHVAPDPDWAAALIAAHAGPWAAVGPVARNANPDCLVSWADFALSYSPWVEGAPAGAVAHLPGHNSSYKRTLLLAYGDALERLLGAESVLHWDLRARGHQLWLEPAARIAHLNFGLLRPWLTVLWHASRLFAAVRAQRWPAWRRALYALGSPGIPLVRLVRIARHLRHADAAQRPPWLAWPLIVLGLLVSAAGEGVGYARGGGHAAERMSALESHRLWYTRKGRQHA